MELQTPIIFWIWIIINHIEIGFSIYVIHKLVPSLSTDSFHLSHLKRLLEATCGSLFIMVNILPLFSIFIGMNVRQPIRAITGLIIIIIFITLSAGSHIPASFWSLGLILFLDLSTRWSSIHVSTVVSIVLIVLSLWLSLFCLIFMLFKMLQTFIFILAMAWSSGTLHGVNLFAIMHWCNTIFFICFTQRNCI